MNKDTAYYKTILRRYIENNCSPQEADELFSYLQQASSSKVLLQEMDSLFKAESDNLQSHVPAEWSQRVRNELFEKTNSQTVIIPLHRRWYIQVAAAVITLLFTAVLIKYLIRPTTLTNNQPADNTASVKKPNDIQPGTNKALLTLADGKVIELDSTQSYDIATQGGTVLQNKDGLISYDASTNKNSTETISFNTVSTPKGGQYQIVLPDGSKVWLNAASSLKFPTAFKGVTRTVELTGEGYFEIAKNEKHPFHVKANDLDVEVLGTHFNVMAYGNEKFMRTSLLEGSVKLNYGNKPQQLKPGQQGEVNKSTGTVKVGEGNMEEAIAWKNGSFYFDNASLTTIMRQLERWYDIEVDYVGNEKQKYYSVEMSRNMSLSQVLKLLNAADIQFKIEKNKLSVIL